MDYSPTLLVHILGGTIGLVSGSAAVIFRKGSRGHILAGRVFVASMLTMSAAATYLAIVKHQSANIVAGLITFYLVTTAWVTIRRKEKQTGSFDWLAMLIPLTIGVLNWMTGIKVLRSGHTSLDGVPVGMLFFMGSVWLLAAAGDLRMLLRGGLAGTQRLARHLWRMCFGLFIASGSFFLGGNNRPLRLLMSIGVGQHLPTALFNLGLYLVLTIAPLVLLVFWLFRVRHSKQWLAVPPTAALSNPASAAPARTSA